MPWPKSPACAEVEFWDAMRPQIRPNNFLHKGQNHNWQRVSSGGTPGKIAGTVPLTFALLKDPADLKSGDGSDYTYTVIAE